MSVAEYITRGFFGSTCYFLSEPRVQSRRGRIMPHQAGALLREANNTAWQQSRKSPASPE
jgi:hypothetical protein